MRPETSVSVRIPAIHAGMTDETPAMDRVNAFRDYFLKKLIRDRPSNLVSSSTQGESALRPAIRSFSVNTPARCAQFAHARGGPFSF
jgi:hypothetical protein